MIIAGEILFWVAAALVAVALVIAVAGIIRDFRGDLHRLWLRLTFRGWTLWRCPECGGTLRNRYWHTCADGRIIDMSGPLA